MIEVPSNPLTYLLQLWCTTMPLHGSELLVTGHGASEVSGHAWRAGMHRGHRDYAGRHHVALILRRPRPAEYRDHARREHGSAEVVAVRRLAVGHCNGKKERGAFFFSREILFCFSRTREVVAKA